jgi:hypothetical protein
MPQELAQKALQAQREAPAGSLLRRAAGCAVIVLIDAKTPRRALQILAAARLDDTIRAAAETLIRQLATTEVANSKEIAR